MKRRQGRNSRDYHYGVVVADLGSPLKHRGARLGRSGPRQPPALSQLRGSLAREALENGKRGSNENERIGANDVVAVSINKLPFSFFGCCFLHLQIVWTSTQLYLLIQLNH